jgi:predicted outer membrane protein
MKLLTSICAAILLVGCASTKNDTTVAQPQITALSAQKLTTSFKRQGVKLEWSCFWGTGWSEKTCVRGEVKAIEVTAYATSNGNSENVRELAFRVAETQAKAKLRHFISEDIYSSRVINTLSKNLEKANDRIKTRIDGDAVSMSDDEASKDTNWAIRENTNDITRTVVEVVRANAQGILRGVYVTEAKVVDRQTVSVTIRWDKTSNDFSKSLQRQFGN